MDIKLYYDTKILNRYRDLINSGKTAESLDNKDISKIFEYYSCIKLTEEYNENFYEYGDIDNNFKEENQLSNNDTGIDACNLKDAIVQCKLRSSTLTFTECATFFASQNIYNDNTKNPEIRWNKLIIARNTDCKLSTNLVNRNKLFIDKTFDRNEFLDYCEQLYNNPPKIEKLVEPQYKLRYYQEEAINLIKENNKNVIISLPTGTGKNSIIIYSMDNDKKYLILVPRIILMEQLEYEIKKHKPERSDEIQLIGDGNIIFNNNKKITICVYNSIALIKDKIKLFNKIYIDEAHHIYTPEIYKSDEEIYNENNTESDETYTYIDIIKNFKKLSNNVYLSATIDEDKNCLYYKKDIRDMIEEGYINDYTIHIPIFNDDPTNRNICEHILRNYRSIIIYCNTQKEGEEINKLMNNLQKNSSEYIDCNTPHNKRNNIIDKFKKGILPFLVNVRILVEGFDCANTLGVCFMHLPKNKTTLIQIIGRALRLHENKKYANIILPYSTKEDENNISSFINIMSQNDRRIQKSYKERKTNGYISIENIIVEENNVEEKNNIELKYEMVYNSMGKIKNGKEIFMKRYEELKSWVDTHKRLPRDKKKLNDIETTLGVFCSIKRCAKRNNTLSEDEIELLEEIPYWHWGGEIVFDEIYNKIIKFIEKTGKLPEKETNDEEEKKLYYICQGYKNTKRQNNLTEYKIKKLEALPNWNWGGLLISKKEKSEEKYKRLKAWIEKNNRLPRIKSEDIEEDELGIMISKLRYKNSKGKLKKTTKLKLEEMPIWYWNKKEENKKKCEKLREWVKENNRLPKLSGESELERYLYKFSIIMRKYWKKNKLSEDEIGRLDEIPYWYWRKDGEPE